MVHEELDMYDQVEEDVWEYEVGDHHVHIIQMMCGGAEEEGACEDGCWGTMYSVRIGDDTEADGECEEVAIFRFLGHAMLCGVALVEARVTEHELMDSGDSEG
jgi:hypothetical protein